MSLSPPPRPVRNYIDNATFLVEKSNSSAQVHMLHSPWQVDLVTVVWHVLTLRMEERPPIWTVAGDILNKRSRRADKGWSSSGGVARGANNSLP
jgi:hypothetical protein